MTAPKAKRKLHKPDFSKEGMHMALVSVDQQGPANGVNTLLMKSLQGDLTESQIESLKEIAKASGIPEEEILKEAGVQLNADGEVPVSETKEEAVEKASEPSPTDEVIMTTENVETIEKSVYEAELAKAKQEAEEIRKGLELELEEFKKAKEEGLKAEFLAKAKEFEDVVDADMEQLAVALRKASEDADMTVLVDSFTKLAELSKKLETAPEGHGVELEAAGKPTVADIFKSKKSN